MQDFHDRLAAAMKHSGTSLDELIQKLGISYQAVKKVLDGKSKFNAENTARAARITGVDLFWLATGEGQMVPMSTHKVSEPEWPFPAIDKDSYYSLKNSQRILVQAAAMEVIESQQNPETPRHTLESPPQSTKSKTL